MRRAAQRRLPRQAEAPRLTQASPLCAAQEPGEHSNLYVSNLAAEVDDATLAEAFGSCGGVVSACVWRDQNTKQRCASSPAHGAPAWQWRTRLARALQQPGG